MQRTAEQFRTFLLDYLTADDQEAFTIDAFKNVDSLKETDTFIRELNNTLWVQTMGSQIEFPYGKCIHHTHRTHKLVYGSVHDYCAGLANSLAEAFRDTVHAINRAKALAELTKEELESFNKPCPKEIELVVQGRPGTDYVLWSYEPGTVVLADGSSKLGRVKRKIRVLLPK